MITCTGFTIMGAPLKFEAEQWVVNTLEKGDTVVIKIDLNDLDNVYQLIRVGKKFPGKSGTYLIFESRIEE